MDEYRWEPARRGAIPAGAQPHGRDQDGEALWLCRAHFAGGLHPGKVRRTVGGATIAYGGSEHMVPDYEVLMEPGTWAPARAGAVPETAVPCGREAGGEPLYAARVALGNVGLQLGKVRPAFGAANVGYADNEIIVDVYEVLVAPGTVVPPAASVPQQQVAPEDDDDFPTYSNLREFAGLPVVSWNTPGPVPPAGVAWLVDTEEYGEPLSVYEASLERILSRTGAGGPAVLVLGEWGSQEAAAPYEMLIRNAGRLGNLRALFSGDMTSEQVEISWIQQSDITPLLAAFPKLERLWIRGGSGLELTPVRHTGLTELVIQSGGLPPAVVRAVGECDLPRLTHLELWLGVQEYEGGSTLDDLAPLLAGRVLPALTHLGLCNAENADEIAVALAAAPVVARLAELDLSYGTLGDEGGTALLAGQPLSHLHGLNLRHHFLSAEIAGRLVEELPGVAVNVSHPCAEEGWGRYTLAAE